MKRILEKLLILDESDIHVYFVIVDEIYWCYNKWCMFRELCLLYLIGMAGLYPYTIIFDVAFAPCQRRLSSGNGDD